MRGWCKVHWELAALAARHIFFYVDSCFHAFQSRCSSQVSVTFVVSEYCKSTEQLELVNIGGVRETQCSVIQWKHGMDRCYRRLCHKCPTPNCKHQQWVPLRACLCLDCGAKIHTFKPPCNANTRLSCHFVHLAHLAFLAFSCFLRASELSVLRDRQFEENRVDGMMENRLNPHECPGSRVRKLPHVLTASASAAGILTG